MLEGEKKTRFNEEKIRFWGVHFNGHGIFFNGFWLNQTFNQSLRRVRGREESRGDFLMFI